ncbi:AAA ATPase containing von Willebrand factor type A (vWA) domain-like protein [Paraglaciecola sp. T6c]|uniref:FimV/HubP family polar landmark protein n=1 Tax=Pseudoalteromonas atlantica (strain T6c / ATCC BAA-1087) TaxID=3042615 RepID=UPI00005C6548|nr:FimV/HubP family polar landmark protein [Paraglaciecola sp. T6c]ABG41868.1 AAA ATPase containing von Willebrand factor type A (vWA) domain-like protein [Paraglaciecola sp. T6c]
MNLRTLALLFVASLTLNFSIGLHAADFQQIRIKGPKSSDSDYSGQTYGPITAADTLWRIASDARQNTNHSIYQVMLATYELNPDAFERNNINLMRDGAILRLPASQYVNRVNEAQAISKVRYDNQLLNLGGETLGDGATGNVNKKLASKDDLDETKDIIEKRLGAIDEEQNRQFQEIRQQFAESILSVQTILNENQRVFESLDSVNKDLAEIRSQEEIRDEQMSQMGKSIEELLAKSRDAEAKALAQQQEGGFTDWLMKPLTLIISSILISLLILGGFAFWLMKRKKPQEMDLDLLATKDEPADTYVASEMDDLSDALSEELTSELDDDNLFGEQDVPDDVLAEELKDSFDDTQELDDTSELAGKEEFDDLGDDMLVPDSELNPTEEFEAGSDELDQDDLDNLFEDEDDLLAEIDEEMDNISLSDEDKEEIQADAQEAETEKVEIDDTQAQTPEPENTEESSASDDEEFDFDIDLDESAKVESATEAEIVEELGDEDLDLDDNESDDPDVEATGDASNELLQETSSEASAVSQVDDSDEQPEISIDDLLVEPKPELPESSEVNADDPINEDMLEQLDKEIASQSEELDNITSNLIDELEQVEMMQDMLPDEEDASEPEFTGTPQHDIQELDKITEGLGDIFAEADSHESEKIEHDVENLSVEDLKSADEEFGTEVEEPTLTDEQADEFETEESALSEEENLPEESQPLEEDLTPEAANTEESEDEESTQTAEQADEFVTEGSQPLEQELTPEVADANESVDDSVDDSIGEKRTTEDELLDESGTDHEEPTQTVEEVDEFVTEGSQPLEEGLTPEAADVDQLVDDSVDEKPATEDEPLEELAADKSELLEEGTLPEAAIADELIDEPAEEEPGKGDEASTPIAEQADEFVTEESQPLTEETASKATAADESVDEAEDEELELDTESDVLDEDNALEQALADFDESIAEANDEPSQAGESDTLSDPMDLDDIDGLSDFDDGELEKALADFDDDGPETSVQPSQSEESELSSDAMDLDDIDAIGDFDDDELERALDNFVLDDNSSNSAALSDNESLAPSFDKDSEELDEFPELGDWLNEVDEDDKGAIENLESGSFDDMLQSLDEDLGDAISATTENTPSPSNTNQAGQDIDDAVDIATLLEESDPHEQERDFLDVDDLLNDSITADPSPEKALDLESVMGEFSGAQGDVDHIDVDSDDGFGAKLDLAHAYIEIGETESATELLEEIIENGHPPQSDEAKRVLASLSEND